MENPKRDRQFYPDRQRGGVIVDPNCPRCRKCLHKCRRHKGKDLKERTRIVAKMGDCLKELDESEYWFELLTESGVVAKEKLSPWLMKP